MAGITILIIFLKFLCEDYMKWHFLGAVHYQAWSFVAFCTTCISPRWVSGKSSTISFGNIVNVHSSPPYIRHRDCHIKKPLQIMPTWIHALRFTCPGLPPSAWSFLGQQFTPSAALCSWNSSATLIWNSTWWLLLPRVFILSSQLDDKLQGGDQVSQLLCNPLTIEHNTLAAKMSLMWQSF